MKKKITIIGIVVVVSLVILIWGLNYFKGQNLFKSDNDYFALYNRVDGLTATSPIYINGFKVGQVREVYFTSDTSAKLVVHMRIGDEFPIPENSIAQIYSFDIMGTKAIRIIRAPNTSNHKTGDTLASSIEGDLKEQVNIEILPLKRKAEDLISSFDSVLTALRVVFNASTRENLRQSFLSIRTTIANLEKTTFTLDTLLTTEKSRMQRIFANVESISGNIRDNNEKFNKIITNFSNISDSLAKADVANTLITANKTLTQLNQIVDKINSGQGSIGLLLNNDTIYNNLESASYNLNRLMRDVHANPKKYVHFSLIDLGKTTYVVDEKKKAKKTETINK